MSGFKGKTSFCLQCVFDPFLVLFQVFLYVDYLSRKLHNPDCVIYYWCLMSPSIFDSTDGDIDTRVSDFWISVLGVLTLIKTLTDVLLFLFARCYFHSGAAIFPPELFRRTQKQVPLPFMECCAFNVKVRLFSEGLVICFFLCSALMWSVPVV